MALRGYLNGPPRRLHCLGQIVRPAGRNKPEPEAGAEVSEICAVVRIVGGGGPDRLPPEGDGLVEIRRIAEMIEANLQGKAEVIERHGPRLGPIRHNPQRLAADLDGLLDILRPTGLAESNPQRDPEAG